MPRSFFLGRAFGIPLSIHPTFFLLPALVAVLRWADGLTGVLFSEALLLAVFGCVLLHELGHALMARAFGIATRDITLYPVGGVARLESTGRRPFEEVCIALAGPAVNLAIVLLLSPLVSLVAMAGLPLGPDRALDHGPAAVAASFLASLWVANGVLMLFNLLPVFPMDGGRVLRAALAAGLGWLRATEVAAGVAVVLGLILCVIGVLIGTPSLALVPLFVIFAGQMELSALRQRELRRSDVPVAVQGPTPLGGFTGFVWDRDRHVWVRWVDGRPVEAW
ncbi:MAG: site-2 protease family protein [Gemmataceae bacterium]